jgi:hypothetical protein
MQGASQEWARFDNSVAGQCQTEFLPRRATTGTQPRRASQSDFSARWREDHVYSRPRGVRSRGRSLGGQGIGHIFQFEYRFDEVESFAHGLILRRRFGVCGRVGNVRNRKEL